MCLREADFLSKWVYYEVHSLLTLNMYFLGRILSQVRPVIVTSIEFPLCPASPYFFVMIDKGNSGLA